MSLVIAMIDKISIHALRVEGDRSEIVAREDVRISIHALRVEGDPVSPLSTATVMHFYPRPPGGGRPGLNDTYNAWAKFLSTPSGWRATCRQKSAEEKRKISIHALRVEGDIKGGGWLGWVRFDFYPRPPGGGRPVYQLLIECQSEISIHALRVEGDSASKLIVEKSINFYPRPPGGGRPR